ncbi:MAG: hypothetical protein WC758_07865 [Candidatus Woesearchaeota archaeon]|jgi:hypothetical protein
MVEYRRKPKFYVDSETKTVAIQDKFGKMKGRRLVHRGERSDMTHPIRSYESGEIFGRAPSRITKFPIKADSNKRATTRTLRRSL